MKETIYTKPLRMPDSRPTRINDTLKLIEEGGQITKIERTIGGKTEEISTGGSDLTLIPGEWLDNVEEHFFPSDPSNVASTIGYYVTGIYKIDDEWMDPYKQLLFGGNPLIFCNIKDNIKNKLSPEFVDKVNPNIFLTNILLGDQGNFLSQEILSSMISYFESIGYHIAPNVYIITGTCLNTQNAMLEVSSKLAELTLYYYDLILCLKLNYILATKDDSIYLLQLTLFD